MANRTNRHTPDETREPDHDTDTGEVVETTELVAGAPGDLSPAAFADLMNPDAGFVTIKTIKIGDPRNGASAGYSGVILGPGELIHTTMPDGKGGLIEGDMPTWFAHPAKMFRKSDGKVGFKVFPNITHRIVAAHQVHQDLLGLTKLVESKQSSGNFAIQWNEKKPIKGGARTVNDFSFVYEPTEGIAVPPAAPKPEDAKPDGAGATYTPPPA